LRARIFNSDCLHGKSRWLRDIESAPTLAGKAFYG
jgi:hypothetical protein